jgi:fumarate hydratase class II
MRRPAGVGAHPIIGYHDAAKVVKKAQKERTTLREA